jgi:hypothetical protein
MLLHCETEDIEVGFDEALSDHRLYMLNLPARPDAAHLNRRNPSAVC